jgi:hypothetical protein
MSADSRLEDAIREVMADEHGASDERPVVGWALVVATLGEGHDTPLTVLAPDGMPAFSVVGLLHCALDTGFETQ